MAALLADVTEAGSRSWFYFHGKEGKLRIHSGLKVIVLARCHMYSESAALQLTANDTCMSEGESSSYVPGAIHAFQSLNRMRVSHFATLHLVHERTRAAVR